MIKNPNIIVGDYTYYDDINGAEKFEEHVTHHYDFIGDKLIIGKFCAIGKGVEFPMVDLDEKSILFKDIPHRIMLDRRPAVEEQRQILRKFTADIF